MTKININLLQISNCYKNEKNFLNYKQKYLLKEYLYTKYITILSNVYNIDFHPNYLETLKKYFNIFYDNYKNNIICSICLTDIIKNKVYLHCKHFFHKNCILKWLQNKDTCPYCRKDIKNL